MTYSNYLSDYDKETAKLLKESKLLIIDLDGTLIDFEKIDNTIVSSLFPNSRIINSIDNLLWKINRLDIIGNGYFGLKLRLAFYSLFSKYTFKECKKKYGELYHKLAKKELICTYKTTLAPILDKGYDIVIVTKNVYAKELFHVEFCDFSLEAKNKIKLIILKKNKSKKFKEIVNNYEGKACIVGNNLYDDVINSFRINLPYVYIGKSFFVRKIISATNRIFKKRGIQFSNFTKVKSIWL